MQFTNIEWSTKLSFSRKTYLLTNIFDEINKLSVKFI